MSANIPEPVKGGDFSSITTWAQQVTRACNAFSPFAAPGMLIRDGAGGSSAEPLPQNRRANREGRASSRPWTFSVESSTTGGSTTFTAKWNDGAVQYGYQIHGISFYNGNPVNEMSLATGGAVSWSAATLDALAASVVGNHWLQINLKTGEYSIVVQSPNSAAPQDDLVNSIVNVWIGTVEAETDENDNVAALKQSYGIYTVPVLYKYV